MFRHLPLTGNPKSFNLKTPWGEQTIKIIPKPPVVFLLSGLIVFFIFLTLYFKFVGPILVSMTSVVTTKTGTKTLRQIHRF